MSDTVEVLYLVLDSRGEHGFTVFHVTEDQDDAWQRARNINGVAIGFPVAHYIADFRPSPDPPPGGGS